MHYVWKPTPEIVWALITAAAFAVFQVLVDFDPSTVTDWKTWAIAAGAGVVRAVAGAGLALMGPGHIQATKVSADER